MKRSSQSHQSQFESDPHLAKVMTNAADAAAKIVGYFQLHHQVQLTSQQAKFVVDRLVPIIVNANILDAAKLK